MKLSDVPLGFLETTTDWLTSANNKKGRLMGIASRHDGKHFRIVLDIQWVDGIHSYPDFPDECTHITVAEPVRNVCGPYVDFQLQQLEQHRTYIESVRQV